MKIIRMSASSFWKGEAGVRGLVEDQGEVFKVNLYLGKGRVRDYSCSCAKGNSYKGMCAHGEALFAYYKERQKEGDKPAVYTSGLVHSMIREYTNREVGKILAEDGKGKVSLLPVLIIEGKKLSLELKAGAGRFYAIRDLSRFKEAVEAGSFVEYGRELAFHHQKCAFSEDSQELLSFLMAITENQGAGRSLVLSPMSRDRFFQLMMERELEVVYSGGIRTRLLVEERDPAVSLRVERYGRDGIRVLFQGILRSKREGDGPCVMNACFEGEDYLYVAAGQVLYCCGREASECLGPLLKQIVREREESLLIGQKDIPLFYERVLKHLRPFSRMVLEDVDLDAYRPEPLQASFRFDVNERGELLMEPQLSYGSYTFHPLEDENVPRTICRDVPGEFRVSQLIQKYFKYKDPKSLHLVIKEDEDSLYRLLDTGLEEFRLLGDVYVSDKMKQWKVLPPPKVSVGVSVSSGWLKLSVDMGDINPQELTRILTAYTQKLRYYRLKNGQFLQLGEGGLCTVSRMASELGISRRELTSGRIKVPAYRAMYIDSLLKEGPGISYYRDQLFKAVVRGLKSVEDSEYQVPEPLQTILRDYQKAGFRWMKTLDSYGFGGILADDMGLGKTLQMIALLEDAYENGEKAPSLIVCPASLVYNWEHEIGRFAPMLGVCSLVGSSSRREERLRALKDGTERFQVLITSYDLLKRDVEHYKSICFRYQVADEAQYIKNASTFSARAVKAIDARTRFALTGTPVENRLGELWSIFDYLMPGFLFSSQHFKKEYEGPIVRDGDEEALKRLQKLIGPFVLRRVKKDVLKELPEKLEQVVYSAFGEEQKKLYAANVLELKKKLEAGGFGDSGKERLQILKDLMRLRQICCHPGLCYENYKKGSGKLETCMALVRKAVAGEHKILLFSQFTSMLGLIEERIKEEGISCYKLTGATSKEERSRLVDEFQRDGAPVFLISLKAGGTGLNLTAADIVIHYDPWWNAAAENQATDRSHRIGQEKQVTVYKLIARNTIEENILKLQALKQRLSEQIVTEGTLSLASLTKEDILSMISGESC